MITYRFKLMILICIIISGLFSIFGIPFILFQKNKLMENVGLILSIIAIHVSIASFIRTLSTTSRIRIRTKKVDMSNGKSRLQIFAYNSGDISGKIKIREVTELSSHKILNYTNDWTEIPKYTSYEINIPIPDEFHLQIVQLKFQTLDEGKESKIYTHKIKILQTGDQI